MDACIFLSFLKVMNDVWEENNAQQIKKKIKRKRKTTKVKLEKKKKRREEKTAFKALTFYFFEWND